MNEAVYHVTGVSPVPWKATDVTKFGAVKNGALDVYQRALREELPTQNGHLRRHDGDLIVGFYFWVQHLRGKRPDTTNLVKATEDACNKLLYADDVANRIVLGWLVEYGPHVVPHVGIRVIPYDINAGRLLLIKPLERPDPGPDPFSNVRDPGLDF